MENPIIIAKILGIYMVVSGAFLLLRGKTLPILLKDFFEHRSVAFLAGAILVFLGSSMILQADLPSNTNFWFKFIGWFVFIKGAIYMLVPEMLARLKIKAFRPWVSVLGLGVALLGIYLIQL